MEEGAEDNVPGIDQGFLVSRGVQGTLPTSGAASTSIPGSQSPSQGIDIIHH